MKKHVFRFLLVIVLLTLTFSCKDDDDPIVVQAANDLTGKWEFTIIPDQIFEDTALIKGHRASDFEVYSSIMEEVYLHQDGQTIIGFAGPCKLAGTIIGNTVTLKIYDHPNGYFVSERPLSEMIFFSEMTLVLDEFIMLEGAGTYQPYEIYPDMALNTYEVKARRTDMVSKSAASFKSAESAIAVTNWENDICKIIFGISSWVIADLTDGIVRTMSSDCWLHKSGGGYYAFGHQGPGSLFPIFTQSIYYPFELSACQVRGYSFNIAIGGQNITYTALKDYVVNNPPVKEIFKKLGFTGLPQLEQALDDFYNQFGGFGISLFYNTNTGSTTIYVNISNGTSQQAINSDLVQSMKSSFRSHSSNVFVYAGHSITDTQHLRRSPAFVCNSPIIICYVIGTNNVSYN